MCYEVVRGYNLYRRLLVRRHAQRFRKDREIEVLQDM
jgi:hypothetical protein